MVVAYLGIQRRRGAAVSMIDRYPYIRVIFAFTFFCPVVASWILLLIVFSWGGVHVASIDGFDQLCNRFNLSEALMIVCVFAVGALITQGVQGFLLSLLFVCLKIGRGPRAYLMACALMSASPLYLLVRKDHIYLIVFVASCLSVSSLITTRLFLPDLPSKGRGSL